MASETPRVRGLPAVEQAREARSKLQWPSPKFWGWTALVLVASGILHWKRVQGEVESGRQTLMARQRAVAVELGPRWTGLRDKVEGFTTELARGDAGDVVDRDALRDWSFRDDPGLYLRLAIAQAASVEGIRAGAKDSLRDAFTSCLLRVPNPDPLAGPACKKTRDCPQGQWCNEVDHCAPPAQPYNLRVAYRTLRVLSDEWVGEVQGVDDDLRLRVLTGTFDDTMADDIPVAIDLLTRAKYFLAVLDEAGSSAEAAPHPSRVGIWRLSDGKLVVRLRREASAELRGGVPVVETDTLEARQRQANSCALALEVRRAIGDPSAATTPP
jgi:hypothetical protein